MRAQIINLWSFALVVLIMAGCTEGEMKNQTDKKMNLKRALFGQVDENQVFQYTITNENGMSVKILNYGGIVTNLFIPDNDGNKVDVVLGYDSIDGYLDDTPYFGAIVGRYGNRIAHGQFELDGQTYQLPLNDGKNHLHGGISGFDKKIWNAEDFIFPDSAGVVLAYLSKDGEEGFPGNLQVRVTYTLTNENELKIDYLATTDKPTIVNLTHHSYFNLKGQGKGNILDHQLQIFADKYVPVEDTLIPTGTLKPVDATPMDFTSMAAISSHIDQVDGGYDHTWALNGYDGKSVFLAAKLIEPESNRMMEVFTDQPGVQFYTGNFLDGSITGKQNTVYEKHYGLCLETQHYPDSPNQPGFPSVELRPGEKYRTTTIYKFGF